MHAVFGERYELLLGLRYTRAKRRNHFISFISLASMLGIGLGVATLIVVLSVMNGFESELRSRILGMASHATISGNSEGLPDWSGVAAMAQQNPEVAGTAPYIEGEALVKVGGEISGTVIRGILPIEEAKVSEIGAHMASGTLADLKGGDFNIVLGFELAQQLGVAAGDKVDLMIPQLSVTPAGVLPRFRRFNVVGVFRIGMYEFDRGLVLVHLDDAAALYRMGENVTGVRLKLNDLFQAPRVAREIAQINGFTNIEFVQANSREFTPAEPVDVVWTTENYHDFHNGPTANIAGINKNAFDNLKPGGVFYVEDHSAAPGAGLAATTTVHRMDEDVAKAELTAAGFRLDGETNHLRNPSDNKAGRNAESGSFNSDRFGLRMKKPG